MPPPHYRHESKKMSQRAGWLPSSPHIHHQFLRKCHEQSTLRMGSHSGHAPSVARFEAAIRVDPVMLSLFDRAFLQADRIIGVPPTENLDELLYQMDIVISYAPTFYIAKDDNGNEQREALGCPMFVLFDLLSNTQAGFDLFRMPAFNVAMKGVLDAWGEYLTTPSSADVLSDGSEGWFSPAAVQMLEETCRGSFNRTYVVPDATAPNKGFNSWDAFFTREVQPDARPVAGKDDPTIIHNACEGTIYKIAHDVKLHDKFWLKTQPYSLHDMLDESDYAPQFVRGTVYQVYLSPLDYHRWHSPLNGKVTRTALIPGTYYAVLPDEGFPADDHRAGDPHDAQDRSMGWLTTAAARALIFIESDNPDIGLMCFIGIGMSEVSTCEILVKEGDHICAGQQIGMFHYGGSSNVLIFGPQAKIVFVDGVKQGAHQLVNSVLARVQDTAIASSTSTSWFSMFSRFIPYSGST